jgi:hypothetical protein
LPALPLAVIIFFRRPMALILRCKATDLVQPRHCLFAFAQPQKPGEIYFRILIPLSLEKP